LSGGRRYWIVDPASKRVEAYALNAAGRFTRFLQRHDRLESRTVAGWYLKAEWLWATPQPRVPDVLAELGVR
jgi:hypothetical protein